METAELERKAAWVRRNRVPGPLVRSFSWYRALDEETRVAVDERIGMCVGSGPCDAVGYVLGRETAGISTGANRGNGESI